MPTLTPLTPTPIRLGSALLKCIMMPYVFYSYGPYVGSARAQRARGRNLAPSASPTLIFLPWSREIMLSRFVPSDEKNKKSCQIRKSNPVKYAVGLKT